MRGITYFSSLLPEHHSWRRRVLSSEHVAAQDTNMWGRAVTGEYVRCHTEDVCEACGETRRGANCLCDTAHAERCATRLAWIDSSHATK